MNPQSASVNPFKHYRETANLKQSFVAKKLNIAQSTIAMWECGKTNPRAKLLPRVAELYGCSVDSLLERKENK
ncbi:MAG: helix-turn-helix domain-containing protein [Defluviitaleaceae bacterium]|nr:helix-turn-helix domain-containing protein [Defluviitaleaceae bacterium]